jgi:hypothetical protein
MTPVQRGQTLALLELFEAAMKAKKQEVVGGVREGLPVEYYSLRKRKGNASICDPVAARALLQTLLDDEQILGAATLSVGKLVDAVADKLGVTKVEAEEQVRSALAPVMNSGAEISFLQRNRKISGLDVLMGRVPVSVDGDEESKQLKE